MTSLIKEEPIDLDETNYVNINKNQESNETSQTLIDKQFESELTYLNNINYVFNSINQFEDEDFNTIDSLNELNINIKKNQFNQISLNDLIKKINPINNQTNIKKVDHQINKQSDDENRLTKEKYLKQIADEKRKILNNLLEAKEKNLNLKIENYEQFNQEEEEHLLNKFNNFLSQTSLNNLEHLKRFRTKLELRKLKRKKHLKLFDIDSYVNELIDREKLMIKTKIKKENLNSNLNDKITINNSIEQNYEENDEDIIFETSTLKTISNSDNNEIIEISNILDRFKNRKYNHENTFQINNLSYFNIQSPIGMVESRNDDIKCLISPYTKQILKPYVWKDFKTYPIKLELNKRISKKCVNDGSSSTFQRCSIDYVHLRPEHVIPINTMCRQHFWAGIDISECLEYPDYTLVALYKKLIIGFAFLVPNIKNNKEAYLSFIFVHPDWRNVKCKKTTDNSTNVSIAQFMIYYLIQSCPDCDITLHVSVNSPVVIFYQKFGFEIEEYIRNFYDKYYSDEHNLNKDAFLMRLSKN